jgi:hypothetical protein
VVDLSVDTWPIALNQKPLCPNRGYQINEYWDETDICDDFIKADLRDPTVVSTVIDSMS